ncbi:MFS transporter [Jiangella aurantiaca]|uniref:MFS transporter n=1 Tax=Jiangella aurantiaca TaxID=2530373 RepID=A0A4R5AEX3_9ACTN|nr:MFS transporter [Jiangella aurantiaca]TDD69890.1 MFS transporter [Jiangella aurantiaca]
MTTAIDLRRVQRRTMSLLMVTQVLGSIAVTVTFAVSGILAMELSGSTGAAGLTQATLTLGAGAASYLLATWMNRCGRRIGMAAGYLVGALGAGLCVVAAELGSFGLLVAGTVALGASSASTNVARYAATDLARPERRATALSMVVWVATTGAVLGPLMVGPAEDVASRSGLPALAGPFLFDMTCAAVAGLLIVAFLRPDPLLVARQARETEPLPGTRAPVRAGVTRFGGAAPTVAALVLAHATMVAVMVMTPLEMHREGATHTAIGAVISVHFLGMYAFAPLSGLLADRAGVRPALVTGGSILTLSLAVSAGLAGTSGLTHGLGLFLLGLGWSVCTVAASSHIAACSVADTRIQGAADTAMTLVSAGAAAAAGPLMALGGFAGLLALAAVFTTGVLLAATRVRPARSAGARESMREAGVPEPAG